MTTTKQIRTRCRARRQELGLTQAQAAAKCGWSQSLWSRFECGRQPSPGLDTIRQVMKALKLNTKQLDIATT